MLALFFQDGGKDFFVEKIPQNRKKKILLNVL